ncbi:MAG: lactonase family protein [Acidimicrobiales bacterium]
MASGPALGSVVTHALDGPVLPFGVAIAGDSRRAYVSDATGALDVLALGRTGVSLARHDALFVHGPGGSPTPAAAATAFSPLGLAMVPGGRYLLAAEGDGAAVLNVARLDASHARPASWVTGRLRSPGRGAIEAAVSPNGAYAFVSMESSGEVAVFRLAAALRHGFGRSDFVGMVPTDVAPVGMAFSPGGRYLYVTSEAARSGGGVGQGTLTTVDVARAVRSPARSVVSTVPVGCSPVRVVAVGRYVDVTARGSDAVVELDAADLVSRPASAVVGDVAVGEAPVGLAVVDGGRTLVAADSDRFGAPGAPANLAVVSVGAAGRLSLDGYVAAGAFPRDEAVSHDGRWLLVTDYLAGEVEAVSVGSLP